MCVRFAVVSIKFLILHVLFRNSTFSLQFVEEYLTVYKIPPGIKICDGTWNVFIIEVINRYSNICIHITLSTDVHAGIQELTIIAFFLSSLRELEHNMSQINDLLISY